MSSVSLDRLVRTLRSTSFVRIWLQDDGLDLQLSRERRATTAAVLAREVDVCGAISHGSVTAPTTVVGSPAPGIFHLVVRPEATVSEGQILGTVQMHRRAVPVMAAGAGLIVAIHVEDGAFVEYGSALLSLGDQELCRSDSE